MRISLIVAALVALPVLAGCGSDEPEITRADLSKSLQDGGLQDPKMADCAAKNFVDQGISQDGLKIMTKPGASPQAAADPGTMGMSDEDSGKARAAAEKIMTDCLKPN